jgi:hypothetical protein
MRAACADLTEVTVDSGHGGEQRDRGLAGGRFRPR